MSTWLLIGMSFWRVVSLGVRGLARTAERFLGLPAVSNDSVALYKCRLSHGEIERPEEEETLRKAGFVAEKGDRQILDAAVFSTDVTYDSLSLLCAVVEI
jgi:hypothetical protein